MPQHPLSSPGAPRRILAAVHMRGDDRAVIGYAAQLAASLHAELILVGIAPVVPAPMTPSTFALGPSDIEAQHAQQEVLDDLTRENLDELASTLPRGLPHASLLTWDPPGPATVAAAREQAADLVVVPMRAREHALGHVLHDHADRYVLHHCDVPVLVVPTTA